MTKFTLMTFIKNLKYLGRYNLKNIQQGSAHINTLISETQLNNALDNLVYELPSLFRHSKTIFRPKIKNFEETLDELINQNKSLIRFGDGEVLIMENRAIGFQDANPILAKRLQEIIKTDDPNLMIGINYHYFYSDLLNFLDYPKFVYRTFMNEVRSRLNKHLVPNKQYYTAGFTSVYQTFNEYDFEQFYNRVKKIWQNKDITIVCGDKTFEDIDYNIFESAKSIQYIYAPFDNAWEKYDKILEESKKTDKSNLVIAILGPTAKVLCFDLYRLGYRCLDLGHIAKDYDCFMKATLRNKKTIGIFFEN